MSKKQKPKKRTVRKGVEQIPRPKPQPKPPKKTAGGKK